MLQDYLLVQQFLPFRGKMSDQYYNPLLPWPKNNRIDWFSKEYEQIGVNYFKMS